MHLDRKKSNPAYICGEARCPFCWRFEDGYFHENGGKVVYPDNTHELLKPALVREQGYLYIAAISDGPPQKRTWRCAVKDCANTIIDESKHETTG